MEERRSRDTPSLPNISTGTCECVNEWLSSSTRLNTKHRLLQKKIQPAFKPSVVSNAQSFSRVLFSHKATLQESVLDVANFDSDFTNEEAQDSVVEDSHLSETVQDQFKGFTYNPANEHLSESVNYGHVMG